MSGKTWVQYSGVIVTATKNAIGLGKCIGGDVGQWIPRSLVGKISYCKPGDPLSNLTEDSEQVRPHAKITAIEIPLWLAQKNGWA